ncbi:MAG: hypothetical protein HQL37_14620, partial [Alphaproteobacteria bacterium]|nr:hypothetical protein [Alphaproteobacteria bacterium]
VTAESVPGLIASDAEPLGEASTASLLATLDAVRARAVQAGRNVILDGAGASGAVRNALPVAAPQTSGKKGRTKASKEPAIEKNAEADAAREALAAAEARLRDALAECAAAWDTEAAAQRLAEENLAQLRNARANLDAVRADSTRRFRAAEEAESMLKATRTELKAARAENAKLLATQADLVAASEAIEATLRGVRHELSKLKTDYEAARGERDRLQQRFTNLSRTAMLPWSLWWGGKSGKE